MVTRLLVLDLDGTLLGDFTATRRFLLLAEELLSTVTLAYVTGRTYQDAFALLDKGLVPMPHFLATFTGSALHEGPDWRLDDRWQRRLQADWSAERVRAVTSCLPGVVLQAPEAQHRFRCSYRVPPGDVGEVVARFNAAFAHQRVHAKAIASSGGWLDVVPRQGGKVGVVRHLQRRLKLEDRQVAVCGNDGNDLGMLAIDCAAIAVGNMPDLWRCQLLSHVYQARAAYADGIVEGLRYWGWLKSQDLAAGAADPLVTEV
jgi:sucrose-6F-phosphate phosphohydrolase